MTNIKTEIKHSESRLNILDSIEADLNSILTEEILQEFANDISCCV
ncbi:MAG: hypothetical protein AAF652_15580 [Cyanobacteria bacterium P01_C01_bin.72]